MGTIRTTAGVGRRQRTEPDSKCDRLFAEDYTSRMAKISITEALGWKESFPLTQKSENSSIANMSDLGHLAVRTGLLDSSSRFR